MMDAECSLELSIHHRPGVVVPPPRLGIRDSYGPMDSVTILFGPPLVTCTHLEWSRLISEFVFCEPEISRLLEQG